jgi:hypothetical protein
MMAIAFCLLLLLVIIVKVIGFMEGERLLLDAWYEYRLHRMKLSGLDEQHAASSPKSKVIISLTSIPSRLPFMEPTLKSLLRQTSPAKEIHLYLPAYSQREKTAYVLPPGLKGLKSIRIIECDRDWGPATKFIPAVLSLPASQDILVVDDDRIYPPHFIADLLAASQELPGCALSMTGWNAPADLIDRPTTILSNLLMMAPAPVHGVRLREPRQMDILQGMSGYLIKPEFFDLAHLVDYGSAPSAAFFVDDVWMGAQCLVPKFVISTRRAGFPVKGSFALHRASALGRVNRGNGDHLSRNNTIMLKHFADRWLVQRESASSRFEKDGF